jgi:hypothetical protein
VTRRDAPRNDRLKGTAEHGNPAQSMLYLFDRGDESSGSGRRIGSRDNSSGRSTRPVKRPVAMRVLMLDIDGVIVRAKDGRHWSANLESDLCISPAVLQNKFFKPHWEEIVTGRANLDECLRALLVSIAPAITPEQLLAYWFQKDAELDQRVFSVI